MGADARRGRRGERAAAAFLRRRGWRVLATRWRGAGGELDLVAVRAGVLAFCEVKTRGDGAALAETLTALQRVRIARAAETFLAARPELVGLAVRFDLITVLAGRWRRTVRHVAGAFEPHARVPGGAGGRPRDGEACGWAA